MTTLEVQCRPILPAVFLQGHSGAHRLDHLCAVSSGEFAQSLLQKGDQVSVVQQGLHFMLPYDNRRPGHGFRDSEE